MTIPILDDRDDAIIDRRMAAMNERDGIRVGDWVILPDGKLMRASYVWRDDSGNAELVQLSHGGSWYLGDCGCDFSGSLDPGIQANTLWQTGLSANGEVWIFHHGEMRAHNAVYARRAFRVFRIKGDDAP